VSENRKRRVAVVMGSKSDWEVMSAAVRTLEDFDCAPHVQVLSAHRMPDELFEFASSATLEEWVAIIAGAGGAAHLPGMLAAKTLVPVLGVPVPTRHLAGHDSLYSIVQMPAGTPVATFAIGEAGAVNAALFALSLLAADDNVIAARLVAYRAARHRDAVDSQLPPP
jgi:5-(carboxyamino)imidazole ribonucleotide mutase